MQSHHFVSGFDMTESITYYARQWKTVKLQTSENIFVPERDFKNVMSVFTSQYYRKLPAHYRSDKPPVGGMVYYRILHDL